MIAVDTTRECELLDKAKKEVRMPASVEVREYGFFRCIRCGISGDTREFRARDNTFRLSMGFYNRSGVVAVHKGIDVSELYAADSVQWEFYGNLTRLIFYARRRDIGYFEGDGIPSPLIGAPHGIAVGKWDCRR